MKRFAALLLVTFALVAHAYDAVRDTAATAMLEGRALTPIEGIWQFGDGAVLLIKGTDIIILDGPDLSLAPYTKVGSAKPTGTDGRNYTLTLATEKGRNGALANPRRFSAVITDARTMRLTPAEKWNLHLWMTLRFYITASVREGNEQPKPQMTRIYPAPHASPLKRAAL